MFSSFSNSGFSMRYYKMVSNGGGGGGDGGGGGYASSYTNIAPHPNFDSPALGEGHVNRQQWINISGSISSWTLNQPQGWAIQRFNNRELGNAFSPYNYDGLTQRYYIRLAVHAIQTQKLISLLTPFTSGTYTVGIKMNTIEYGYAEEHKLYIKIGGVDVFPNGLGFVGIGSNPTTQPWINPINNNFDVPTTGNRTIEIWSVGLSSVVSNILISELVVYKNAP